MMMNNTTKALLKMIMQGKTGEEYKKLLASLTEEEQREIKDYEKKFKETKLSMHAAENFFNVFKIM